MNERSSENKELEQGLLRAILVYNDSSNQILKRLSKLVQPTIFDNDQYRKVYQTMLQLKEDGHNVDILTITDALGKREPMELLSKLNMSSGEYRDVTYYVEKLIKNKLNMMGEDDDQKWD